MPSKQQLGIDVDDSPLISLRGVLIGIAVLAAIALFVLWASPVRAAPLILCDDRGCRQDVTIRHANVTNPRGRRYKNLSRARKPREARRRVSRRAYVRQRGMAKIARVAISGRPRGCPARSWCGCFMSLHVFGRNLRQLWLARAWASVGRPASGPAPGVIAVYARGRGGHVGRVVRVLGPGRIVLLSGNDGGRVRQRERSTKGIIAWRRL